MKYALIVLLLAGCSTTFTPVPYAERTAMAPVVRWIVADDVHVECLRRGAKVQPNQTILGCAISVQGLAEQCIVITSNKTTHEILGHEVRHCFEPIWKGHG